MGIRMDQFPLANLLQGAVSLATLGFIVYAVRVVIAPMKDVVKGLKADVRELYNSRDDHSNRLTAIETVHRVKGCEKPK